MITYPCDCKRDCCTSSGCCINGGECHRTIEISHIKFPSCYTCWFRTEDSEECKDCELDEIGFPTNWKNEDPEGEWK